MEWVMQQLLAVGAVSPLVYGLVLLAGVASALSPCFVPVLTLFAGYIGGYAQDPAKQPLRIAAAFTTGQVAVLAWVGVVAVLVGRTVLTLFTGYQLDRWIPAGLGIVMGLQLLGVFKFHFPLLGRLQTRRPQSIGAAFTLGLPFGLVVTPCTIPVFITVLAYVALTANVLHGALLMVAYGLGRGLILGLVAYSAGIIKAVRNRTLMRTIERASGVVILAASFYLIFFYSLNQLFMPAMPAVTVMPGMTVMPTTLGIPATPAVPATPVMPGMP